MKKISLALALAFMLFAATVGRSDAFLDKTRFAAHLGIAYFAFHHWVMRPYEQGSFVKGAPHRIASIVKGGAALLFAVHEVRVSQKIARNSKDPLLQKLNGGLGNLATSFAAIGQKLKGGQFSPSDVSDLNGSAAAVASSAAADGAPIRDVPAAIPGL
ncbi:MAG: hypothetical protein GIX03_04620 [Candidatus Eremiobacteraeota bacterium]|nr:hypothetical protein [Candidatus Eremiobacteraeota bacterium]MBC5802282.1 hypothetical protein [Candidatus Eremiobacteraeota bacterium]MBC5822256.1 hypothetical protein [Candidatus Eremiobacteraeota bacterium]